MSYFVFIYLWTLLVDFLRLWGKSAWLSLKRSSPYSFHRFRLFSVPTSTLSLVSLKRAHRRRCCLLAVSLMLLYILNRLCFAWKASTFSQFFASQDSLASLYFLRMHLSYIFVLQSLALESHRSSILVFLLLFTLPMSASWVVADSTFVLHLHLVLILRVSSRSLNDLRVFG